MSRKIDVYVFPSKEARNFRRDGICKGSVFSSRELESLVEEIEEQEADNTPHFWYFSALTGWLSYREAETHLSAQSSRE